MREWWIRTVLVLSAPRPVFAALRDDSNESAALRSEPVLLVVWLAGMAFVLSTRTAAHLMDGANGYDALLVAVWTFLAGGLYGGVVYWLLGGVLHRVGAAARIAGLLPPRPPRARVRHAFPSRCRSAPLAGQARGLRQRALPRGRPRLRHGREGLRGARDRLPRLVGVPARDRRPRRARLEPRPGASSPLRPPIVLAGAFLLF